MGLPNDDDEIRDEPETPEEETGDDEVDDEVNGDDEGEGEGEPREPTKPMDLSEKALRQAQLNTYQSGASIHCTCEVNADTGEHESHTKGCAYINRPLCKDENPPGTTERTYKQLAKVWMPLILDQVGGTAWTVNEVTGAMRAMVRHWALDLADLKSGFSVDDGMSEGNMFILKSLYLDRGKSPFGYYCSSNTRKAIAAAARNFGSSHHATRKRRFGSDVASTSAEVGADGSTTIGDQLSSNHDKFARISCPNCTPPNSKEGRKRGTGRELDANGNPIFKTVEEVDPQTGQKVSKKVPVKCHQCHGSGISSAIEKNTEIQSSNIPAQKEDLRQRYAILTTIINKAGLSARQLEVYLLSNGLESAYDKSLSNSNAKNPTEAARILGVADAILKIQPEQRGVPQGPPTGIWVEAEKKGLEKTFQEIWDQAFGELEHRPFDPEIPVSLQISALSETTDDTPYLEGVVNDNALTLNMSPFKDGTKEPDSDFTQSVSLRRLNETEAAKYQTDVNNELESPIPAGSGPFHGLWLLPNTETKYLIIAQNGKKVVGAIKGKTQKVSGAFQGTIANDGRLVATVSMNGSAAGTGNLYGDRLDKLIILLRQQVADIEPNAKTKQFIVNLMKTALERINAVKANYLTKYNNLEALNVKEPRNVREEIECVDRLNALNYAIIMERVENGTAMLEEIRELAYFV